MRLATTRGDRVLAAARRPGTALALADLARQNRNVSVLSIDVTDGRAWVGLTDKNHFGLLNTTEESAS